jgi:NAD(P)-dependent dehydrogenase (short-subunit alcohol dehydrogenase family)
MAAKYAIVTGGGRGIGLEVITGWLAGSNEPTCVAIHAPNCYLKPPARR